MILGIARVTPGHMRTGRARLDRSEYTTRAVLDVEKLLLQQCGGDGPGKEVVHRTQPASSNVTLRTSEGYRPYTQSHGLAHQLSYVTATSSRTCSTHFSTTDNVTHIGRLTWSLPTRFLTLSALPRHNVVDGPSCGSMNDQVHRSEADLVHLQICRPRWQVSSLSLATMALTGAVFGIENIKGDHIQQIDRMPEIG